MDIQKDKIKNILIIRRNNIGDMICAIPMFRTLRKEFPNAHITVLAEESNAGIIEGASFTDDIIIYKKGPRLYGNKYLGYYKLFRQNKRRFDLAISAKAGFSSLLAFITVISGAKIRMGCVPDRWHPLQFCYNFPVKGCRRWKSFHQVDGLLEFIKTIGIDIPIRDMSIEVTPDSVERVRNFFNKNKIPLDTNIVVFNISNNKPENRWPPHKFKELGDMFYQKYGATSIITSTPSDMDKAITLSKQIVGKAFYFNTPKVMDFAALVAESDLLICGEGGAMHIGSGVRTSTISLWGKLRPVKWAPYGEKQFVVKKGKHVDSISADDISEVIKKNRLLNGKRNSLSI